MNASQFKRLQDARKIKTHGEAVDFYEKRWIKDTGRQPHEWSAAQWTGFKADMELWRSTLFKGTHTDAIKQTARRHGQPIPATENEARLFVAWATAIGEPGFDPPPAPSPKPRSLRLRNAQLCAWMEEGRRDCGDLQEAARRVRGRLHASGYKDMPERSIQSRYHEEKRRIAAINEEISRELGSDSGDEGLTPELAMLLALVKENRPTPMERAALAMVNPRWLQIAPWAGESSKELKYSYKPELAMLGALVRSQPTPMERAAFATTDPQRLKFTPCVDENNKLSYSYSFTPDIGPFL